MPEYHIDVQLAIQELENGCFLGENLLMPEFSRLHDSLTRIYDGLVRSSARAYQELELFEMHRRHWQGEAELREVKLTLEPPRRSERWRYPLPLLFHAVIRNLDNGCCQAWIPALKFTVLTRKAEELDERISQQIRMLLHRRRHKLTLEHLLWLQRCRQIHLTTHSTRVLVQDLKKRAEERDKPEQSSSVLQKIGIDLGQEKLTPAYEMEPLVDSIAELLKDPRPTSILLIGPSGAGKTAALYEVVRQRKALQLGKTAFWASSGARIVAGQTGFGMWQERCKQLCKECIEQQVVLCLGNLVELMEVGKSESNSLGVASFLRSYIQRGDLRVIVECTNEQLALIERLDPYLLDQFQQIRVEKPSPELGQKILQQKAEFWEQDTKVKADADALEIVMRLHQRYAGYSAFPGRPLRFLDQLMHDAGAGDTIRLDDVFGAFSKESGLPRFMLDDALPLDLATTEKWFQERVIGQDEAVKQVVAQLALSKTALSRPGKPLASLLFIGPTGVGKTELAKVLAEFLFGDADRLSRFDMSEYADLLSVERLIGGSWSKEGLLTAKVREQPFSVLLLDEVEKAHPLFFDLLLQITGEARLSDRWERTADFSNCVIIMTSNLGSQLFRKKRSGFGTQDFEAGRFQDLLGEVRAFFRPELVNRLDRIAPFYPLERQTLFAIARRQIAQIAKRDGIRTHQVELEIEDRVLSYLAESDYDPRYGARPLRRRIEREILAPLAQELNERKDRAALLVKLSISEGKFKIKLNVISGERERGDAQKMTLTPEQTQISNLRRKAQRTLRGQYLRSFRNQVFHLKKTEERLKKRKQRGRFVSPQQQLGLDKLPLMEAVQQELERIWLQICECEDQLLFELYAETAQEDELSFQPEKLRQDWRQTLLDLYCLRFEHADQLSLALFCKQSSTLFRLCRLYHNLFSSQDCEFKLFWLGPKPDEPEIIERHQVEHIRKFLDNEGQNRSGGSKQTPMLWIVFEVLGKAVFPLYAEESGVHRFQFAEKKFSSCLAHSCAQIGEDFQLPEGLVKHGSIEHHPVLREYKMESFEINDRRHSKAYSFRNKDLEQVLNEVIEVTLHEKIEELLLEE